MTVIVKVSAVVSLYLNTVVEVPSGILTVEVFEPPESIKTPDALDDESVIVVTPDVAALPKASCLWTVKSPLAKPAGVVSGLAIMTSCDEAAGFTVNDVVAEVRPAALFVIVNDSALVSKYLKVPDELPEAKIGRAHV